MLYLTDDYGQRVVVPQAMRSMNQYVDISLVHHRAVGMAISRQYGARYTWLPEDWKYVLLVRNQWYSKYLYFNTRESAESAFDSVMAFVYPNFNPKEENEQKRN